MHSGGYMRRTRVGKWTAFASLVFMALAVGSSELAAQELRKQSLGADLKKRLPGMLSGDPATIAMLRGIYVAPLPVPVPESSYFLLGNIRHKRVAERDYPVPLKVVPMDHPIIRAPKSSIDDCQDAERALSKIENEVSDKHGKSKDAIGHPRQFDKVWRPLTPNKQADLTRYTLAVERYVQHCMTPYAEIVDDARALGMDRLAGTLQVQVQGAWFTFCSAFRITPTRIVTARHCFHAIPDRGRPPTFEALAAGQVAFTMSLNSPARYIVREETCGLKGPGSAEACKALRQAAARGYVVMEDDYLVLEVNTSAVPMPRFEVMKPTDAPREVTMVTWTMYPEFVELASAELKRQSSIGPATGLFLPRSGSCLMMGMSNDVCLLDGCQSSEGTSGAALLSATNGGLQLLGIHLAAADSLPSKYGVSEKCDVRRARTPSGRTLGNVSRVANGVVDQFLK